MQFDGKNVVCVEADGFTRLAEHDSIPEGMFAILLDDLSAEFVVRLPHPNAEGHFYKMHLNVAYGEIIKYEMVADEEVSGVHRVDDGMTKAVTEKLALLRAFRDQCARENKAYQVEYLNAQIIVLKELAGEVENRHAA